MEQHPFDRFAQTLAQPRSRRGLLRVVAGGLATAAAGAFGARLTRAAQPCSAGLVDCGGSCVDLLSDPQNCGGCGIAAGLGGACQNGVVIPPPPASRPTPPPQSPLPPGGCRSDGDCGFGSVCNRALGQCQPSSALLYLPGVSPNGSGTTTSTTSGNSGTQSSPGGQAPITSFCRPVCEEAYPYNCTAADPFYELCVTAWLANIQACESQSQVCPGVSGGVCCAANDGPCCEGQSTCCLFHQVCSSDDVCCFPDDICHTTLDGNVCCGGMKSPGHSCVICDDFTQACCAPGQSCHGGQCCVACGAGPEAPCCPAGQTCSSDKKGCCPPGKSGTYCKGDCCAAGQTCVNGQCTGASTCPPDRPIPCPVAPFCCPADNTCCDGDCCTPGFYCCTGTRSSSCCNAAACHGCNADGTCNCG